LIETLNRHCRTGIANSAQLRPLKAATSLAIAFKLILNGQTILARDIMHEVVQEFPLGTRITGSFDALINSEPALAIGKGPRFST